MYIYTYPSMFGGGGTLGFTEGAGVLKLARGPRALNDSPVLTPTADDKILPYRSLNCKQESLISRPHPHRNP